MKNYQIWIVVIMLGVLLGFCFADVCFADIKITKEQFDNLDILHEKIQERYPQFKGFNGSKDKLECIGLSDETVLAEIEIIDIPTIKAEKEAEKKAEKDAKKLKKMKPSDLPEDKIDEIIDWINTQI